MKFLDFGCPHCEQPFQIEVSETGRIVRCPSCAHAIEIPANNGDSNDLPEGSDSDVPKILVLPPRSKHGRKTRGEDWSGDPVIQDSPTPEPSPTPTNEGQNVSPGLPSPIPPIETTRRAVEDQSKTKTGTSIGNHEGAIEEQALPEVKPESEGGKSEEVDFRLPPRFDVFDPKRAGIRTGKDDYQVVLPDGQGGTAQLDNRVLRVKHGESEVSLVSMSPKQRSRRRLIQNILAILIAVIIMAITFWLLK